MFVYIVRIIQYQTSFLNSICISTTRFWLLLKSLLREHVAMVHPGERPAQGAKRRKILFLREKGAKAENVM